jgi:hypothetical protein
MARHLSLAPRNLGAGNFLAITVKEVALKTIILSAREESRAARKRGSDNAEVRERRAAFDRESRALACVVACACRVRENCGDLTKPGVRPMT